MDISKTYIKMSDCEEIQGKWEPEAGDTYLYKGEFLILKRESRADNIDFWLEDIHFHSLDERQHKKDCTWLPRQDQLQDMVKERFAGAHSLIHWFEQWFTLNWLKDSSLADWSMEQLWLAFVMKEKYNKAWNGKNWISEVK